jgi:RimJ/RimL family protein N-acetyltransferase
VLPDVPRLTGRHVVLEPLSRRHVDALVAAAGIDRSTYDFTLVPDDQASMRDYVDRLDAAAHDGSMRPFAQVLPDGRAIGCTRFMEPRWWRDRPEPDEVEVGGTWLAHDVQRTPVNTEAKRLLLGHAFDVWGAWRVALCTDARNHRSRAAIERLGATFEGVLRSHRPVNALHAPVAPRDTAVFSIIAGEWPAVRDALDRRLAAT